MRSMSEPPPSFDPHPEDVHLPGGRVLRRSALNFSASRSGGPGGQNVNKVNTKATLTVAAEELAAVLPGDAVRRLPGLAGHRWAGDRLVIAASDSRSLVSNRRACVARLRELLVAALHRPRVRRATRPSRGVTERRLDAKKRRGALKRQRRGGDDMG
ncbi:MAG: alternative ribosome rescue aminoacyl-tRNA hydrolase ArfB [Planctomycetota bacterium]